MSRKRSKNVIIILIIIIATTMIGLGAKKAWDSFKLFENSVVDEKDSLLYNITVSMDASISNEMDTFVRECKYAFQSNRTKALEKEWLDDETNKDFSRWFTRTTLVDNPMVCYIKVTKGKSTIFYKNNGINFEYLTEAKSGVRICMDENRAPYLMYEYKSKKGIKYQAALSMNLLYAQYSSQTNPSEEKLMLYYADGGILITEKKDTFTVADIDNTKRYKKQIAFFDKCIEQELSASETIVRNSSNGNGTNRSLRMYVLTKDKCKNKVFDIGASANYEEAITSSTVFARTMMMNAALAVVGATILLAVLLLIIWSSNRKNREMEDLRRRNEQMEEINRQMQVVTHHQRLETIGTMTAGLAHDFNNLLTPIMGYSLMSMEMLDENSDLYDNLLEIYNSSCKAKDIVARLTELSRKGKSENTTVFSVDKVADGTMTATLPVKPKTVKLHGELDSAAVCIRGDETQISQLIMNLILNAYDALERVGGTVSVKTKVEDDNVVISVRDDGPGMPPEVISKIFDPFYTTKESGKGTGLGLAITAQIVETHGGKIYVDSEVGKGTEFRISFPVVDASDE